MILIEAGDHSAEAFDRRLVLAGALAARGHRVVIDEAALPDDLPRPLKYEAAAYVTAIDPAVLTCILILGPLPPSAEVLARLRAYRLDPGVGVTLIGSFADRQAGIAARAAVAYAIGREPQVIRLTGDGHPSPLAEAAAFLSVAPPAARERPPGAKARLLIVGPAATLAEPARRSSLQAIAYHPGLSACLVATDQPGPPPDLPAGLPLIRLDGQAPLTMAAGADLAVFLGDGPVCGRQAAIAAALLAGGRPVIDCTPGAALVATGAPVLQGPDDWGSLGAYLDGTVLPNLNQIARFIGKSPWLAGQRLTDPEALVGPPPPPAPARPPLTLFLPTNGIGLGHAQRSCLIAAELTGPPAAFAAFPSCVALVQERGFDAMALVQKSPDHPEPFANDIVNHQRLGAVLQPGDRLVFDGGHVFHSIERLIAEKALDACWIRRGLWQPGPGNDRIGDRERLFRSVIVPTEAFAELNAQARFGDRAEPVGPVVQRASGLLPPEVVRERLRAGTGRDFARLVVTMLGAGFAADRSAQMQTVAALCERRADALHLVVVWPGAVVPPALYGWQNTRVVRTHAALALARAADLVISAAGYNSFHEALYHRLPTIFVPQMSEFMDDQTRRARAASDRGLAATVMADDLLMLGREVAAFLDHGKAAEVARALAAVTLPEPGNRAAARLIEGGPA